MAPRTRKLIRALHHPVRATMRKHIRAAEKPVPLAELADVFNLELPAARYHVGVLRIFGLAVLEGEGSDLLVEG